MERLTIDEVIAHCRRHTKDMEEHATPFFFNEAGDRRGTENHS